MKRRDWSVKCSSHTGLRGDINVTPLVDVCLVLLIIFMVVTPMIHEGVDVALPDTKEPIKIPDESSQIILAIRADGSIWLGPNRVEKAELAARLKDLKAAQEKADLVLRGDRSLPFSVVREVMEITSTAGFPQAGLVTLKRGADSKA